MEWITIIGQVPSKSNNYTIITLNGHGSLAKTKVLKNYEEKFFWQIGTYRNKNIEVPFEIHIRAYYTSIRSDIDNALKIILDCLQRTKTIKNDNLCCKIIAEKFVDKNNPRIEIKITEV